MSILIASNNFLTRHFIGNCVDWRYGTDTFGDSWDHAPFNICFDYVFVSLDLKQFHARDVARYYRKMNRNCIIVGLGEPTESVYSYFDYVFAEPKSEAEAKLIINEVFEYDGKMDNISKSVRDSASWQTPNEL